MTRRNVLVVEDEEIIRHMASEMVEVAGFAPIEAANADEALVLLERRHDIDALFTDVEMPGSLNGLALAHLVHERWPGIRIVVTSGRVSAEQVGDEFACFLAKPYVFASVERALQG